MEINKIENKIALVRIGENENSLQRSTKFTSLSLDWQEKIKEKTELTKIRNCGCYHSFYRNKKDCRILKGGTKGIWRNTTPFWDKNRKMVCLSGNRVQRGKKRQKQNLDLVEEKVC